MSRFAENTSVSSENSRAEIERTLSRYGASKFMYGWEDEKAIVGFEMDRRHVRFIVPLPDKEDYRKTPGGKRERDNTGMLKAWEQACRQRWRALALVIKAKLEAVESGITVFEEEFMAHIVLPNGQTVGQHMIPQIAQAYESGNMPPLLPYFGGEEGHA